VYINSLKIPAVTVDAQQKWSF